MAHATNDRFVIAELLMLTMCGHLALAAPVVQDAANNASFAGTLVWQLVTINIDDWSFDFNPQQPGFSAISRQIQYFAQLVGTT